VVNLVAGTSAYLHGIGYSVEQFKSEGARAAAFHREAKKET
jgi:hypothetical protein